MSPFVLLSTCLKGDEDTVFQPYRLQTFRGLVQSKSGVVGIFVDIAK